MPWASASKQPVVGHLLELERPAHLEVEAVADQHEGDVVQGVGVALAQLVGPDDQRVVQQAAAAARLGGLGQPLRQIGHLLAIPLVDLDQLLLRLLVAVGVVRQLVMALVDAEPAHPGPADRVGVLQGRHAGEVGGEAVDHEVDLHLADLGHVVVLVLHARLDLGNRVADVSFAVVLELLLHLADEGRMLLQQLPVFRR